MSNSEGEALQGVQPSNGPKQDMARHQDAELDVQVCEHCDWVFLVNPGVETRSCPYCSRGELAPYDGPLDRLPHSKPPEMYLPFALSEEGLSAAVNRFAGDIPFAPADLTPTSLRRRLQRIFVPMWLVDAHVRARWEAEAGFDYQVVSHRDRYVQSAGGWEEVEHTETRVRWEPRLGQLDRTYENVAAPALEEQDQLLGSLGGFDLDAALPFQPEGISEAWRRLPDRPPADAWSDAVPLIRAKAVQDCRVAAGADHMREFRWTPIYEEENWTQLLLPLFTSYYLDDDGEARPITIHGRRGDISGERRGSMRRAQRTSLTLLLLAFAIGSFSLATLILPVISAALMPLALLGLLLGIGMGLSSILPLVLVWRFNRREAGP